jgi:RNA polymerase sigma-70 factor (ECF subfamily)
MEEATAHSRLTDELTEVDKAMGLCAVMNDQTVDEQTLDACRRGDSEAFRQLFEIYKDRVYSIAVAFFDGDDAAAKDITQQVFLKLMTRVGQFQNRSQFSTWLYRLVTNSCLDRKRALRRFVFFGAMTEIEAKPQRGSIEDRFIRREIEASVQSAIAALKPKLRMAVLLKYFEDLSYEEIAAALGCSKGTVASRLNRAHQILARKLAHLRSAVM